MKILIIDDNEADVKIICEYLKDVVPNAEIHVDNNLSSGICKVNNIRFDVIFLDLNLPDSEGIDTISKFVSKTDSNVIVLTGVPDIEKNVIEKGAKEYLFKNDISSEVLAKTIYFMNFNFDKAKNMLNDIISKMNSIVNCPSP